MRVPIICLALACSLPAAPAGDLLAARDRQDRATLEKLAREAAAAAENQPQAAEAQFQAAQAHFYVAEVALELRDRNAARAAAEAGIQAAQRAVALKPDSSEYHRILGALCGQVIPANVLLALKYGNCARSSIERAIELNPKSSKAWLTRGVGNYYLPASFGGGVELAIRDFQKAIELDPKSAEAYLWLGIALRKAQRNAEARKALAKSLELNPDRIWAKQQLDKTPAQ